MVRRQHRLQGGRSEINGEKTKKTGRAVICLCDDCKAAMQEHYILEYAGPINGGRCSLHPWYAGTEYFFVSKLVRKRQNYRERYRQGKDTRARYRGSEE